MWRETPSPMDLRDAFPDVAMVLDTDYIMNDLKKLGIQHIRRIRRKSVSFEIAMHPHHIMRITPVDKGADGFAEWMTWYWQQPDCEESAPSLSYSIRAFVEIVDLEKKDSLGNISFTIHNDDIESLIKNAITGMKHMTGVRIKPIVIRRKSA
jgi:hypothetical protein